MKTTLKLLLPMALAVVASCSGSKVLRQSIVLEDGWILQSKYEVSVPSTVMGVLGTVEDKSIFDESWNYTNKFDIPAAARGKKVILTFDGVSYKADIALNGTTIATCEEQKGPFRIISYDVTDLVKTRGNVLSVDVYRARPGDFGIGFVDWNPRPEDESMGIFRPVHIDFCDGVEIRYPAVRSAVSVQHSGEAWLTVVTDLKNYGTEPVSGVLRGKLAGVEFEYPVNGIPAGETVTVSVSPEDVPALHVTGKKLWWTYDLGEPYLYDLEVEFAEGRKVLDAKTARFGIREVSATLDRTGQKGFKLNGKDILIRGAGWTDDIYLRNTPERNGIELDYVKDMNFNTIRLEEFWGNSQDLYDQCDEKGLLIMVGWSCFWEWEGYAGCPDDRFGCIREPEDMDMIAQSLKDQIQWLRHHPSIITWFVGSDKLPRPELEERYIKILDGVDDRPVLSSAKRLFSRLTGPSGMKMEGPYDYVAPSYWYDEAAPGGAFGFNTETGIGAQMPQMESIRKMIPEDQLWPVGEAYDRHCTVAGEAMHSLDVLKEVIQGRFGGSKDLDDFVRKAQLIDYDGTRAMFEAFRVKRPVARGIIQWMLNSAWPALYWQMYDWYLAPVASYYSTRNGLAPQQLVYDYKNRQIYAVNNEKSAAKFDACFALYDIDGKLIADGKTGVSLKADSSQPVFEMPEWEGVAFLQLNVVKDGVAANTNSYCLSSIDDVSDWRRGNWIRTPLSVYGDFRPLEKLARADVSASLVKSGKEGFRVTLENKGEGVAFFIRLAVTDADDNLVVPAFWSDNYITLAPGEKREISCSASGAKVKVSGWNLDETIL